MIFGPHHDRRNQPRVRGYPVDDDGVHLRLQEVSKVRGFPVYMLCKRSLAVHAFYLDLLLQVNNQ